MDDLLVEARDVFPHRPGPTEALAAQAAATLHRLGLINAPIWTGLCGVGRGQLADRGPG